MNAPCTIRGTIFAHFDDIVAVTSKNSTPKATSKNSTPISEVSFLTLAQMFWDELHAELQ